MLFKFNDYVHPINILKVILKSVRVIPDSIEEASPNSSNSDPT